MITISLRLESPGMAMKKINVHGLPIALALFAILMLATGCEPPNRVTFKPALVSIDPGEGWRRLDIPQALPACSPRLMGKAGMINAVMIEGETDIKKAADRLQANFRTMEKAIPDSFKQEEFATDSGLSGVHVSYSARGKGPTGDIRSHSFVTHNRSGKCVSISYIASPDVESPAVLEAIRKTLRVE